MLVGLGFLLIQGGSAAFADERGWSYLIEKLVADGVERERVVAAFQDWRVEPFLGLDFSLNRPREPRRLYRRFLRPRGIAAGRRCRARFAEAFETAAQTHGVPADVLAAILFIESGCGRNTGSSVIFYRLARLAMANAPDNVRWNIERLSVDDARIEARVRERARTLEATFYPEVRALFDVADRLRVGPLEIHGSGSGAFGYPQFLPTSYLQYGADGDGDGQVSLYDTADAAASCARYLAGHGWGAGLSRAQRRAVIWQYNHSDAYVDTVLALAARIGAPPPTHPRSTVARARRRSPRRKT